jgi:ribonuclease E
MRPAATPARITPSAVPKPAVASEPVLQWVSTPLPGAISAAPNAPMWRLAARSSVSMARASRSSTARQSLPAVSSARCMRASAQARLTAVGREALRRAIAGASASAASRPVAACTSRAASTTPQAAAMPIAGAPRTVSAWIAAATSSLVVLVS